MPSIQIWFDNGAADGFNVMPPWLPGGFDRFGLGKRRDRDLAGEDQLRITGVLEFFENNIDRAAGGFDQPGRDDVRRAAIFDIARGAFLGRKLARPGVFCLFR